MPLLCHHLPLRSIGSASWGRKRGRGREGQSRPALQVVKPVHRARRSDLRQGKDARLCSFRPIRERRCRRSEASAPLHTRPAHHHPTHGSACKRKSGLQELPQLAEPCGAGNRPCRSIPCKSDLGSSAAAALPSRRAEYSTYSRHLRHRRSYAMFARGVRFLGDKSGSSGSWGTAGNSGPWHVLR